ncbi:BREX-1 system adenine-specific DNA-methyltransferase PglX [Desulfovibrio sp. TomC]|uniref:BREX-1 system adenine-specific DNA-methyltransferase PglX n=1 Tax=Desulfovibrio sp. TomC TaxID=1562888 RepID=UPI0005735A51|nr:BREX-1 system adenine-specific DNA-methyltransferase PglX [Desulfovibrio sp. TomC]KHK01144.1 putative type II restriction enzyme methylase subunit [Desulfovibrio sp. TomC]
METTKLKKFAQFARRSLLEQVSAKLKLVQFEDSAARREHADAIKKLEEAIKNHGKDQVIERVAYIWFNRFCALRFMDVNRYTRIGVVSPSEGQFQPEILAEAKMGHIDDEMVHDKVQQQIVALLDGKVPSRDPQGEAYRMLVVAACNFWNKAMPFLFQRINDYTELLMPDDLLSGNSILAYTREAMTPDACEDVEVIGWLYQFYISEKKDEVFDGLKKNKKITPENIPAATQLFTPHWIVRYLVENSLGRLWLLNRPGSKLVEKMDYYIKPEQPETDFLRINKPEEIKICDPACGSGHMLTYAFDLLYAIYEEEGYEPVDIPERIITNNLYGIEIDERAGELAAFALTMKARAKQRRFFNKGVKPNICVLENVRFDDGELKNYMDFVGRDLFTAPLQTTLRQFEEAENFGSLIRPGVTEVDGMLKILESKNVSGHLFLSMTHQKVLQALRQADYLIPKYHVVIANPPYMGSGNFNPRLKSWLSKDYKVTRSDLYAIFIERSFEFLPVGGRLAMVTMQSWMFTRSYEELRNTILHKCQINTLAQLGTKAFDEITGEIVQTCAFVLQPGGPQKQSTTFIRLVEGDSSKKDMMLVSGANRFEFNQLEFSKIPGKVMVYWTGDLIVEIFEKFPPVGQFGEFREGIHTGDNNTFLRYWWEISWSKVSLSEDSYNSIDRNQVKWIPYNKGGTPVRWYGGNEWVISFDKKSRDAMEKLTGHVRPSQGFYFKKGATWPDVSSGKFGVRYYSNGYLFDAKGPVFVGSYLYRVIAILNSSTFTYLASLLMPTLAFKCGTVRNIPVPNILQLSALDSISNELICIAKERWDASERSWDFVGFNLTIRSKGSSLISNLVSEKREAFLQQENKYCALELQNDQIASEAYGLDGLASGENESTDRIIDENDLSESIRELVSYAVGCMFGRYALDKPGLILANQGETIEDYLARVPEPSFPADDDNVIPMLDGDWFTDDIAERFRKFLRVAFGEEHYEENLQFVEQALNIKGKRNYSIRDYFLGEFYTDHVKRYKKRPIYWLFSSPKGNFNALIYMHRYRPDAVSVVLNDYLREFRTKLTSHKNHLEAVSISASASQAEKTKALKEIEKITKMIAEMEEYEREVLYPLATEQVEIDLDDGVKFNYSQLGVALKKIPGLDAKED